LATRFQAHVAAVVQAAELEVIALKMSPAAGGGVRLVLYVDRMQGEGAVTLEDCSRVARKLGASLDAEADLAEIYELEVSSPGMNRVLRGEADFRRFAGITAKVTRFADRRESFVGVLAGCEQGVLRLRTGIVLRKKGVIVKAKALEAAEHVQIALADIEKAVLQPTLEEWMALGAKLKAEAAARAERLGLVEDPQVSEGDDEDNGDEGDDGDDDGAEDMEEDMEEDDDENDNYADDDESEPTAKVTG